MRPSYREALFANIASSRSGQMNISSCFMKLISSIQPPVSEIVLARQHVNTIKARLDSTFRLRKVLVGGSYSRSTLIRDASDVDMFAVISRSDVMRAGRYVSSHATLAHFRDELAFRYPSTPVRRDAHAIVVHFSRGPSLDVVPAVFDRMIEARPQYFIPDSHGGWMATSPETHNLYIKRANERSHGKLNRVAQLVKYWRRCSSTRFALSSFHLEMLLGSSEICNGVKSHAACVTEMLRNLADRECRALQDPCGISGLIPAVRTDSQREDALASIRSAREHAKQACLADYAGNHEEAWRQWNIVFAGSFPR